MIDSREELVDCLKLLTNAAQDGRVRSVFAVGISSEGAVQIVFAEPGDVEPLRAGITEQITQMLDSLNPLVSREELEKDCRQR